ncbi:two-on-two hemoglobin-3 [Phtheirospermum japonicum]|uniref:Two-on-two hemoglobin-3 n=1 Tax=Phtheirospermum japonicum TaxID=374723 RepID=A0A830B5K3_9LAMI|nr:two-on-two hemoglobin-3 [Phtheirospermum japonicum]
MHSLQRKATEWSGVPPNDAFAIDKSNLYEKLGLQTFINLSTNFYNSKWVAENCMKVWILEFGLAEWGPVNKKIVADIL